MRTYGQYCPIARASELLAERWSFIILRNIVLIGCRTFNEIADVRRGCLAACSPSGCGTWSAPG
jgi:DNA-binding HxlR family transcriptional regulator